MMVNRQVGTKPVKPKLDKRAAPRRPITLKVHMVTGLGEPLSCTLKDVSELGARVAVAQPELAPQQFMILLKDNLTRWCRICWRSDREIGIEFVGAPDRKGPAERTAATSALPPRRRRAGPRPQFR